jgi:hypothetical protein
MILSFEKIRTFPTESTSLPSFMILQNGFTTALNRTSVLCPLPPFESAQMLIAPGQEGPCRERSPIGSCMGDVGNQ